MTDRENRFLGKLGIKVFDFDEASLFKNDSDIIYDNVCGDFDFYKQSPGMFLSLWDYVRTMYSIRKILNRKSSAHIYEKAIKRLESATNKKLDQLLKIWEGTE